MRLLYYAPHPFAVLHEPDHSANVNKAHHAPRPTIHALPRPRPMPTLLCRSSKIHIWKERSLIRPWEHFMPETCWCAPR